jgi:ABC-type taurine transport system substrate-binding protein
VPASACPSSLIAVGFLGGFGVPRSLSRGFSTYCLRFKNGVATTHAKLASGWLARLYREGVEPSGSQQKVSDGGQTLQALTSGSVDVGMSNGLLATVSAFSKGVPIRVISA